MEFGLLSRQINSSLSKMVKDVPYFEKIKFKYKFNVPKSVD